MCPEEQEGKGKGASEAALRRASLIDRLVRYMWVGISRPFGLAMNFPSSVTLVQTAHHMLPFYQDSDTRR